MAHTTQDDGFHEIQLNGKQLIFLFMATTVVSVAIFLVGVMVGRGVRAERVAASEAAAQADSPSADPQPLPPSTPVPAPAGVDLTMVPPPPPSDEAADIRPNTQPDVNAKPEEQKTQAEAKAPAGKTDKAAPAAPDKAAKGEKAAAPATGPTAAATPVVPGWFAQVAALKTRREADAQAKSLSTKGWPVYIADPSGATSLYRVRLGPFKSRTEVNVAADKYKKEMGVTPWVIQP